MLFITRAAAVVPTRLTSWVFLVASAGAIAEIYVHQPLSPGSLHLLACHPSSGLLRPFAEALTPETDLLLRLVVMMWGRKGNVRFESLNVAIWGRLGRGNGFI